LPTSTIVCRGHSSSPTVAPARVHHQARPTAASHHSAPRRRTRGQAQAATQYHLPTHPPAYVLQQHFASRILTALYIYDKPHKQRPLEGEHALESGDMNTDASSQIPPSTKPASRHHPPTPSDSPGCTQNASSSSSCPGPPPATSSAPTHVPAAPNSHDTRAGPQKPSPTPMRSTLPFSLPLFFQSNNTSIASLVPSIAEGKPIPLDDSTAAHRTLALRELNSNFPSPVARHKYERSTGAQSKTYSKPVIVRTYSGPSTSQGHSRSNSNSARRAGNRRGPPSTTSTSISYVSPAAHSRPTGGSQNGSLLSMARGNAKKKLWPWKQGHEEVPAETLPPHEAFSFKTIMANLQAQSNEMDNALDGIAQIYARSRYSLSNQYEVHVAPHGSGSSFVSAVPSSSIRRRGYTKNSHSQNGLTLQAIQSGDEDNSASARSHRKRRSTGRRQSAAYGTLETIMSSSRSSEEDKTKKKSASELKDEVRGRASSKSGRSSSGSPNTSKGHNKNPLAGVTNPREPTWKRSKSFANAIIHADSSKYQQPGDESASPRTSSAALVSELSLPQTSSSHLEIRTTPNELLGNDSPRSSQAESPGRDESPVHSFANGHSRREDCSVSNAGARSGFSDWVPWKTSLSGATAASQPSNPSSARSHAEGTLRELLKGKGKLNATE
ncbi:hypothetical protein diail_8830, partial [Diaporthe ilicicola]